MMRRNCLYLAVGIALLFLAGGNTVRALDVVDASMQNDPQLYVTGYQRDIETGTQLLFVQLYNNSDEPLDITKWGLYVDSVDTKQEIKFQTDDEDGYGYIRPKGHVVITVSDAEGKSYVNGASYDHMVAPSFADPINASLIIRSPNETERTMTYALKATSTTVKKGETVYDFGEVWLRAQSTGAGYNSSFAASKSDTIMDNTPYHTPVVPLVRIEEVYAYSSDCAPTDSSPLCGDYIKLRVDDTPEHLSNYVLRTSNNSTSRTTTNTFYLEDYLDDAVVEDGYVTIAVTQNGDRVNLTNSGGYIWLEDFYGLTRYDTTMVHYESFDSDKQGYSWIPDEADALLKGWWSTDPRPTGPSVVVAPVEVVTTCPVGKYLNPDTNRCRTIEEAVNALSACPEGQYRNPTTNRCKQLVTTTSTLKECGEGQERNPETNRCRSIASAVAELLPCDEGYERNPATNRCRKVNEVLAASAGTASADEDEPTGANPITAWAWALAAVAGTGAVGYGIYEWRHEIAGGWKSLKSRLGRK